MSHNEEFRRKAAEDRRLVILRFLDEEDDGLMSASLMQDALTMMAHRVSRAQVLEDAAWLEKLGLLRIEYMGDVPLLRLTARGGEVADGTAAAPGVKRPRRGE